MKILLTTLGSYGDVYPNVGLGRLLKQRGHTVTLLTNPHFGPLAEKYNLEFVPIGTPEQYDRYAGHPGLFDPRQSVPAFFDTLILPNIRTAYERLMESILPGKTVIASSILVFAARLIQEKHRIPNATLHLSPMTFKSAYEMPKNAVFPFPDWLPLGLKKLYWRIADAAVTDRLIGPPLNALRKEIGLQPVARIMTVWGHSPQRVIGLFPSWYGAPQPDWPASSRLTGFPLFDEDQEAELPPEVRTFLEGGAPPVVFMPGSLMQRAGAFLRVAAEACQAAGQRAIFLSRYPRQIPERLPDSIRYFSYIPFRRLLPRAAALVHHGGIGTCAQALRAGVPQLLHPMAYDQHDNAWRIRRLGAGDWVDFRNCSVRELSAKLQALTGSLTLREHCRRASEKILAARPMEQTAELIEGMK
ncbi:MAG: glycosyltransferase family 1 protein [Anaerolineales bacterium]|nr:glycosyltransferase family 1 protein [Anaerolineales bacterium]